MKRLVLAILVILAVGACSGGKKKQDTTAGSGSAIYAKKIVVSWGIAPKGTAAEIFLETTDETGKQTSFPVGTFDGTCQVIKPAAEMKALTGVNCTGGIELHAVVNDADIVVLKLKVQVGVTPDPMAREEVTRVKAPAGASIESA